MRLFLLFYTQRRSSESSCEPSTSRKIELSSSNAKLHDGESRDDILYIVEAIREQFDMLSNPRVFSFYSSLFVTVRGNNGRRVANGSLSLSLSLSVSLSTPVIFHRGTPRGVLLNTAWCPRLLLVYFLLFLIHIALTLLFLFTRILRIRSLRCLCLAAPCCWASPFFSLHCIRVPCVQTLYHRKPTLERSAGRSTRLKAVIIRAAWL